MLGGHHSHSTHWIEWSGERHGGPPSGERGRAAGCWVLDAGWVLDEASWVLDEAGWVESIDWRGLCTYTLRSPSCVGCAAFPLGLLCEGV